MSWICLWCIFNYLLQTLDISSLSIQFNFTCISTRRCAVFWAKQSLVCCYWLSGPYTGAQYFLLCSCHRSVLQSLWILFPAGRMSYYSWWLFSIITLSGVQTQNSAGPDLSRHFPLWSESYFQQWFRWGTLMSEFVYVNFGVALNVHGVIYRQCTSGLLSQGTRARGY